MLTATNYLRVKLMLLIVVTLEGAYSKAADYNADNSISATDYLLIKHSFCG